MTYQQKAEAILKQPENCEDDNLGDMFNLCCEADRELTKLSAENIILDGRVKTRDDRIKELEKE